MNNYQPKKLDFIDYFLIKYDPEIQQQLQKVIMNTRTYKNGRLYKSDEQKLSEMTGIAVIVTESVIRQENKERKNNMSCWFTTYDPGNALGVCCDSYANGNPGEIGYGKDGIIYISDNGVYHVFVEKRVYTTEATYRVCVKEKI